ncbi:MAG: hypothetical protein ACJAZ8_002802 [Planctomycetota bacterium]|jgi:hypothetical protein
MADMLAETVLGWLQEAALPKALPKRPRLHSPPPRNALLDSI